jgi:hypothetical protein
MSTPGVAPYADNHDHLRDELRRLDLRIRLRIQTLPLLNQIAPGSQVDRTAYISPEEVAWLLDKVGHDDVGGEDVDVVRLKLAALTAQIDEAVAVSRDHGVALALPRITELFGLSEFETQALIICLAPELRVTYDRLYAYLQDDITRKRPSIDLILDLLFESEDERWTRQPIFGGGSALQRWQLVHTVLDPHSPSGSSGLAQFLRLDPRIRQFLLGDHQLDTRLAAVAQLHRSPAGAHIVDDTVAAIVGHALRTAPTPAGRVVLYLKGPAEADPAAVALRICGDHARTVVVVNMAELLTFAPEEAAALLHRAAREAVLQDGLLFVERADTLLGDPYGAAARALRQICAEVGAPLLLGGEQPWAAGHVFAGTQFQTIILAAPPVAARAAMWRHHLGAHDAEPAIWAEDLAARFTLGENRIRQAIDTVRQRGAHRPGVESATLSDLAAACRDQADHNLAGLAVKVEPHYCWPDLVLPVGKIEQLREICDQVRNHHLVYDTWGFGGKLGHGTGLSVLFAGSPGTGKTMAAEVVADAVGLPLFKIDLSGVVSKYIGETEKNLARIFHEAQSSNAILFFDEADALFGKRTEVSDAHDRYANIETSYLLQKLDEHRGLVILASNLRANLDDAFTRRIRYVVEFPFPDAEHRERIWKSHFPTETPVADDIDFTMLAAEFAVAGGSIKNIVLNAAFLAAADGGRVDTRHIMSGTRREFDKLGKLWTEPAHSPAVIQ